MGSENGNPTSMRFAPLSATAGSSSRVNARSGSPAVTNGMNALRFSVRSCRNRSAMGFMGGLYRPPRLLSGDAVRQVAERYEFAEPRNPQFAGHQVEPEEREREPAERGGLKYPRRSLHP